MLRLFKPAIGLMNGLKYPQKFILISFLFALPLAVAMFFLISVLNDRISFSQKELQGTEYLRPLRKALDHAIWHRLLARDFLKGDATAKEKLIDVRNRLDADFEALAKTDDKLGAALRSSEKFAALRNRWTDLKQANMEAESSDNLHVAFIADIRGLISLVGDTTNLILDPDLDSYYLMDAILLKLPEGYDLLQKALVLGDRVAVHQLSGPKEKAELIVLGGLIHANAQSLHSGINLAFKNNGAKNLNPALMTSLKGSIAATEALLTSLSEDLAKADAIVITPDKYRAIGETALRVNFNLWDDVIKQLDHLLRVRINGFERAKNISIGVTAVGAIIVVYLWIGFYLSVIRTVASLDEASKRMVSGKLEGKVNLENRDELGQVATSFNNIATALAETSARRQAVVDNAADGIITVGEEGVIESFNPAAERIFGYRAEEVIGKNFCMFLRGAESAGHSDGKAWASCFPSLANERGLSQEATGRRKDGQTFPMDLAISDMQLDERRMFVAIVRDISERKRAEILRTGQGLILEMIATSSSLEEVLDSLVYLIESQANGLVATFLLLDEDEQHIRHCAAPSLPDSFKKAIDGSVIGPKAGSCGTAMYRRERVFVTDILQDPLWDDYRQLAAPLGFRACWSTPVQSHEGKMLGAFAMYAREVRGPDQAESRLIDLATRIAGIAIERKRTEDRIRFLAHHDVLTGLPNRALLEDRLKQATLYAQRYDRSVTVAFIDLDHFKLINDSLGHNAGDELLKVVAERLLHCVRRTDTVVRMGGDEFVIILFDQPENVDLVTPTLHKIRDVIARPVQMCGRELQVTCSMGVATYPKDGKDVQTLLRNADAAMYHAKELGRNNFQSYTKEMNATINEKLMLQEGLRNAIVRQEFLLAYQPQVDLRSGQIIGAEALIRWRHPELGVIPPAKFVPLAEETGLIVPIGEWVLRTACKQNRAWQDAGLPPIHVAVNVSGRQFRENDLVGRVEQTLGETGLDSKHLELELTESLIVQDMQKAITTMQALNAMGVQLSIDDFGTGYSSLSALKHFPITRLKIDQSFVRNIPDDDDDKAIASAVVALGHELDLRVIAEGVESEEQLAFLSGSNCDEIQGNYFCQAVSAEEFETLLRTPARGLHGLH